MNNEPVHEGILPMKEEHDRYKKENEKYTHYIPVSYGKLMDKKLEEHYVVDFDDLDSLYLSNAVPTIGKMMGTSYIQMPSYFLDYWCFVLSPLEQQVYLTLYKWSSESRFTNIPAKELARRMNRSENTILNALKTLEENFFILKFQRKTVAVGKGNANNTGVYIRINDHIPILNQEQLKLLPEDIKKEHDRLLEEVNNVRYKEDKYILAPTKRMFVRNFILEKCKPEGRVEKDIAFIIKKHGIRPVVDNVFVVDYELDGFIKDELRNVLSKPSYDVFIENSVFILENHGEFMTIICKDEFTEKGLNDGMLERIIKSLFEKISARTGIELADYSAVRFSKYYTAMHNKNLF